MDWKAPHTEPGRGLANEAMLTPTANPNVGNLTYINVGKKISKKMLIT